MLVNSIIIKLNWVTDKGPSLVYPGDETTVTIDANTYQKSAARTINKDLYPEEVEMHALYGMAGEIGELQSLYQKAFQGHKFDEEHAKKRVRRSIMVYR